MRVSDLADSDMPDKGLDLPESDVSVRRSESDSLPGVSLVTGVVFGSTPVSE